MTAEGRADGEAAVSTETQAPTPSTHHAPSSMIEWLELFFDLVVVAAVAVFTDGLREEPSLVAAGALVAMYGALWMSWIAVVLYANVAGRSTQIRGVLVGMMCVAVMAATNPLRHPHRADAFVIAFLIIRFGMARNVMDTGKVLMSWPLLQFGGAALPWIVSLWVPAPWKYLVWGVALVIDLTLVVLRGGDDDPDIRQHVVERYERSREREQRRRPLGHRGQPTPSTVNLAFVRVNPEHLQERLGLFVIIVLGEVVSQLVLAAAQTSWTRAFLSVAIPTFVLLVGLWFLTFSYGFVGAPHARLVALAPKYGLPMHLATTLGVIALAAGIGGMAAHPGEPLDTTLRWIMCGGLALHIVVMGIGGATGGAPWTWTILWALPSTAVPLVLGFLGGGLPGWLVVVLFVVAIAWLAAYAPISARRSGSLPTGSSEDASTGPAADDPATVG